MRKALFTIVLVSLALQLVLVFASPGYLYGRLVADDAWYYLKIAQNVHEHHRFTFDGIHATNGFHPLHEYIVTALSYINDGRVGLIRLVLLCSSLFHLGSIVLLFVIGKRFFSERVSLLGATLWAVNPALLRINLLGLENGALAVLLLSCLLVFLHIQKQGVSARPRSFLLLGILLGISFLARIDEALFSLVVLFALIRFLNVKKLLLLIIPQFFIALPFLLSNWLLFHRVFPISGAVKRLQMEQWLHSTYGSLFSLGFIGTVLRTAGEQLIRWIGYLSSALWALPAQIALGAKELDESMVLNGSSMLFAFIAVILLVVILLVRHRNHHVQSSFSAFPRALLPFFLFVIIHFFSYLIFFYTQIGYADKWYFIPEYLAVLFLGLWVVERWFTTPTRLVSFMTWTTVIISAGFFVWNLFTPFSPLNPNYRNTTITTAKIDAMEWANAHLPETTIIGSWNAGLVGYLSDRPVIHLEGLVNNYDYLDTVLQTGTQTDYIMREGITHLADYEGGPEQTLDSFYGVPMERLEILGRWNSDTTSFYVMKLR